jgi:hypothetical protein
LSLVEVAVAYAWVVEVVAAVFDTSLIFLLLLEAL